MKNIPEPRKKAIAIAIFLCALVFYIFSVVNLDLYKTGLLDLHPQPDAVEYFASAVNLFNSGSYTIQIGESVYPPRYPFGFSLLMLPFLYLSDADSAILTPFRLNQMVGLLMIVLIFLYYYQRRPIGAAIAVATLVTMPAFVLFSRSSMSELTGGSMVLLAYAGFSQGIKKQESKYVYFAAVVLGLSTVVRLQFLFFAPLLLSICFLPSEKMWIQRVPQLIIVCTVFAVAASSMFIYNAVTFGNPLSTGYAFWVPAVGSFTRAFQPQNFWAQVGSLWQEFTLTNTNFRVANLFGPGTYFTPAYCVVSFFALCFYPTTRFRLFLLATGAIFAGLTLFYFFVDVRLYFPVAVLLVPVIADLGERCFSSECTRQIWWMSIPFSLLLSGVIIGFPSQTGYPPRPYTFQSVELLNVDYLGKRSEAYELVRAFRRRFGEQQSLVISPINPVYMKSFLPNSICIPRDGKHAYRHSKQFRFGRKDALEAIGNATQTNRRIFYLSAIPIKSEEVNRLLPPPENYNWKQYDFEDDRQLGIFELSSNHF